VQCLSSDDPLARVLAFEQAEKAVFDQRQIDRGARFSLRKNCVFAGPKHNHGGPLATWRRGAKQRTGIHCVGRIGVGSKDLLHFHHHQLAVGADLDGLQRTIELQVGTQLQVTVGEVERIPLAHQELSVVERPQVPLAVVHAPLVLLDGLAGRDIKHHGEDDLIFIVGRIAGNAMHQSGITEGEEQVIVVDEIESGGGIAIAQIRAAGCDVPKRGDLNAHVRRRSRIGLMFRITCKASAVTAITSARHNVRTDWPGRTIKCIVLAGACTVQMGFALVKVDRLSVAGSMRDSMTVMPATVELNLWKKRLGHVPDWVWERTELETLILADNKLMEISDQIGGLQRLRTLDVGHNHLSQLPDTLGDLTGLNGFLYLHDNRLSSIPKSMEQLKKLRYLNLSENVLSEFPEAVCRMAGVVELRITDNQIEALPECIADLRNLRELHLRNNRLPTLPACIGKLPELRQIDLRGNPLTSLPEAIASMPKLEKLDLRWIPSLPWPGWIDDLEARGCLVYR